MIKIGLLGAGFMGGMHAACYKALENLDVKVVAVADVYKDSAEELASKFDDIKVYESGMDLIENADVDVIDICLPTHLHAKHAVAAMEKGYAVFCEKPVAFAEEDLELMLKTKEKTNAKIMIGQAIRFWSEYSWLKGIVDEGTYGRVLSGVFKRVSSRPGWAKENWLHTPELSGGVALDMHIHDIDFVRYLMGEPDKVQAAAYRDETGFIEHIFSLYNYGKDVAISLEGGWDFPETFPFTASYQVKLEKATIVHGAELTVYPNEGDAFNPELEEEYQGENEMGGNISSLGGYYNELKYFIEGLQGKNDLSIASLEEGIASVRLAKREIEAAGGLITE